MIFEFSQYKIDVDITKTKKIYETAKIISDKCSCEDCYNFVKAAESFSGEITSFFTKLGVDLLKICEVYTYYKRDSGSVLYGGICYVCGEIISCNIRGTTDAVDNSAPESGNMHKIADDFYVIINEKCSYPQKDFPDPVIELELLAEIPWVLQIV